MQETCQNYRKKSEKTAIESKEGASNQDFSIGELLEKSNNELEKGTTNLLNRVVKDYPSLSSIKVRFVSPEEEPNTGGFFDRVIIDQKTFIPIIFIVKREAKHIKRIMRVRRFSNKLVANMLGINTERLTPELLRKFIILHELGHAKDFENNYQRNPKYHDLEASEEWEMHYKSSLFSLPVNELDPAELYEEVSRFKDLEEFLKEHPVVAKRIDREKVKTLDDLLAAQELAYRASPYEKYADDFAVN